MLEIVKVNGIKVLNDKIKIPDFYDVVTVEAIVDRTNVWVDDITLNVNKKSVVLDHGNCKLEHLDQKTKLIIKVPSDFCGNKFSLTVTILKKHTSLVEVERAIAYEMFLSGEYHDELVKEYVSDLHRKFVHVLAESDTQKKELEALRSSLSWKLTLPIRLITQPFFDLPKLFSLRKSQSTSVTMKDVWTVMSKGYESLLTTNVDSYSLFLLNLQKNKESNSKIWDTIKRFESLPKISIIVPVYNVAVEYLEKCVISVEKQLYPHWELCLFDDASTNKETLAYLKKLEGKSDNIKIGFGKENGHISKASNGAVALATGEYIALLDNDDEISEDALYEVVKCLNENPEADFIYSDEDLIDPKGQYCSPHFKSDFNKELLLAHNYITHFSVIRKSVGDSIGWFREGYEGAQDHDLFIRLSDVTKNVVHIPKVLYHWRQTETSTAANYNEKSYATTNAIKAIEDHFDRVGEKVEVLPGPGNGAYQIKRSIVSSSMVSIMIPFRDQVKLLKDCVESIIKKAGYSNYEILLLDNGSQEKQTLKYLSELESKYGFVRVLRYDHPFNYSAINNWGATQAKGDYLLLLNNDTKAINQGWLSAMVEHIQSSEVGAVGAKLLYGDGTVQHAGVVVGIAGIAGHSHRFSDGNCNGYYYRPNLSQEMSAVTGACLLTKKEVWNEIGGLNETEFKIAFNDVDYCLEVRSRGYKVIYTPYAKLYHYESKSRGYEDTSPEKKARFTKECGYLQKKWGTHEKTDPYYNPNLSHNQENFSLKVEL